jgi:hypothetical protein
MSNGAKLHHKEVRRRIDLNVINKFQIFCMSASEDWTPDEHSCKRGKEEMSDTRLQSIKVVAVDDNADARALLKIILKLLSLCLTSKADTLFDSDLQVTAPVVPLDATSNPAERQLRPAVIARKLSCGIKLQKAPVPG